MMPSKNTKPLFYLGLIFAALYIFSLFAQNRSSLTLSNQETLFSGRGSINLDLIFFEQSRWDENSIDELIDKTKQQFIDFCDIEFGKINLYSFHIQNEDSTQQIKISPRDYNKMLNLVKVLELHHPQSIPVYFVNQDLQLSCLDDGVSFAPYFIDGFGLNGEEKNLSNSIWLSKGAYDCSEEKYYSDSHSILTHELLHILLNTYSTKEAEKNKKLYLSHSAKEKKISKSQCEAIKKSSFFQKK
ncbi:hypothetical protein MRY82_05160 [bacterium]|nr:hypothetical protein [bacterium]